MVLNSAQTRRADGVALTVDKFMPLDQNFALQTTDTQRIAAAIRSLSSLGRTERWTKAVEGWARMVENATTVEEIEWAILQGSVGAGHAVV